MRALGTHNALRKLALIAFAGLALTACDDDDDPVAPPSAEGTYALATIEQEGFAACTIGASGCTLNDTGTEVIVLEDGTLTLAANGTFTLAANGTVDGVDEVLGTASGTWVRTQSGVTLTVTGVAVPVSGTFTGSGVDELEFVLPGSLFNTTSSTITLTFDKQ